MNRPAPRKSSLSNASPLTPPPAAAAPAPAPAAPAPSAPAVVTPAPRSSSKGAGSTSAQKYPRLNYYVDDAAEAGRIRAAFLAGRSRYGWRTFSEMQRAGVLALVTQLEKELNSGQPFEPAEAGAVPTGYGIQ